ncbi:peptidase S8/S53 domain-containing protein [Daedaleopsis nitida]|nr:peptidase S8/S53 domain-containing protein [Daedaleopsis nitida]
MLTVGLVALLLFHASRGTPTSSFVVRSQLSTPPHGFVLHKSHSFTALPDELVQLTLALPQINAGGLHAALLDVSDPASENYGRHLTREAVSRYIAPSSDSLQAVTDWLRSSGIQWTASSPTNDMITVKIPLHQANLLLMADYHIYRHETTNTTMLRTLSYSLPAHLNEHVSFVYPSTQFIPPIRGAGPSVVINVGEQEMLKREKDVPASCSQIITPSCLQSLYNIPTAPARALSNNLYISGFGGQMTNPTDLKNFMDQYRPDVSNDGVKVDVVTVNNGPTDGVGTSEASLDVQYSVGLATNVPTTFLSVGGTSNSILISDLLDEATYLLGQDVPPLVLSSSYVFLETPDLQQIGGRLCDMYAALGARGTSVIFASGDGGVAGGLYDDAEDPARCMGGRFGPTFPSTCPYVTSVGATRGINPEVAAPFSSGGFSNIFKRPSYQNAAVSQYLDSDSLGNTYTGMYNSGGRAYPDVSAHGVDYFVVTAGKNTLSAGTSASAPTFASIIALLNDRLLSAGRSPLGFLNPRLYSMGSAGFIDITSGSNPGCSTDGFPADVGWDPVTGLGTPNFDELLVGITGSAVTKNAQNGAVRDGAGLAHILVLPLVLVLSTNAMSFLL